MKRVMIFVLSSKTIDTCLLVINDDVTQEIVDHTAHEEVTTLSTMLILIIFEKAKISRL